MKATRHNAIGGIKRLFDAVSVMAVDVDVEDAGVGAQELEDAEDDVVDVAEPGGFALFGVVQAAGPVYGYVGCAGGYALGGGWGVGWVGER